MKRFNIITAIALVALMVLQFACTPNANEPANTDMPTGSALTEPTPTPIVDPYVGLFDESKTFSGGEGQSDLNLYGITAVKNAGLTEITLEFYEGSRAGGTESETPASKLPEYEVTVLPSPCRIAVKLSGVDYLDYEANIAIEDYSNVLAVFLCDTSKLIEGEEEPLTERILYVQLESDIRYNVVEKDNKLIISLKTYQAEADAQSAAWYLVVNAMEEYTDGILETDGVLTPVLCDNLRDIVLLSKPYDTQSEANDVGRRLLESNSSLNENHIQVTQLKDSELPSFTQEFAYAEAYAFCAVSIGNEPKTLDVLLPNSVYLCDNPINGGVVFSKQKDGGADGRHIYEELWTIDQSGEQSKMTKLDFYTIESVLYSPNGRYFALVETTSSGSKLYLFNGYTNELMINMTNIGFGTMISDIAWDEFSTKLYAIGGSSSLSIHEYDLSLRNADNRYNEVYAKTLDEGSLACVKGRIYFVSSTLEDGAWIYSVLAAGGSAQAFIKGSAFEVSPDGKMMAYVNTGDYLGDSQVDTNIYFVNMDTGEKSQFDAGFGVYDMMWSHDGKKLLYFDSGSTEGMTTGEDDPSLNEYPYELWMYDMTTSESKLVCSVKSTNMLMSSREDALYMVFNGYSASNSVRATYELRYAEVDEQ